jgi:hypothetical protein
MASFPFPTSPRPTNNELRWICLRRQCEGHKSRGSGKFLCLGLVQNRRFTLRGFLDLRLQVRRDQQFLWREFSVEWV